MNRTKPRLARRLFSTIGGVALVGASLLLSGCSASALEASCEAGQAAVQKNSALVTTALTNLKEDPEATAAAVKELSAELAASADDIGDETVRETVTEVVEAEAALSEFAAALAEAGDKATIEPTELADIMRSIDDARGTLTTTCADQS